MVTNAPGLYIFSPACYWYRHSGPGVIPFFASPREGNETKQIVLGGDWLKWIRSHNVAQAWKKITAPDWGPSKGWKIWQLLLKWNALLYCGRNVATVLDVVSGQGGEWGLLKTIPYSKKPPVNINKYDNPDIIHTVYGVNKTQGWFTLDYAPTVPVIGDAPRYVNLKWLTPVSSLLPKEVIVTSTMGLRIRKEPGFWDTVDILDCGASTTIHEVTIGPLGLWGRVDKGWVGLRIVGQNLTDFII